MTTLSVQRENAITAVDAWLAETFAGSARAEPWRLRQHGFASDYVGWTMPVTNGMSLLVAVDGLFPYSTPRTAIFGPDAPADGPHVEDDLRLCTLGTTARTDSDDPVGVVREYVEQSRLLLDDIGQGKHEEDFITDFEAYWRRSSPNARPVWTLGDMKGPSHPTYAALRGRNTIIVADDEARLRSWLSNYAGQPFDGDISSSLFVWLAALPVPSQYPTNIGQLRTLIAQQAPDALAAANTLINSDAQISCLVFGGQTAGGEVGRGAFVLTRPSNNALPVVKGFRPGMAPPHIMALSTRVAKGRVLAVDAANTRLPAGTLGKLTNARVTILGCGSLGSGVARILAQSGVRSIRLYDPDLLGWENIGRHELGAQDVGKNKATALAANLRRQLPDCDVVGHDIDWRQPASRDNDIWENTEVIVSTTADWGSDCALSDLQAAGAIGCPIVFGWMERNAAAAHAVALAGPKITFRAGFDATGNANLPATAWWEPEVLVGCGAGTSAYGAVELGIARSHTAELVLDIVLGLAQAPIWRVAVTSTAKLQDAGGYWSTAFKSVVGDPGTGARTYALKWG